MKPSMVHDLRDEQPDLVTLPGMAFPLPHLPTGAAKLRQDVRQFLDEELQRGTFTPRCDSWVTGWSPDFSRKLGERGWLGMTWPSRYGGHEASALNRYVVTEELLAAGAPVAAHWIADRQTGPMLLRYGTETQRESFLPGIARGEVFFAIGMSEPDSGSDLASLRTRAERDGEGWRVTGRKVWTSHAHRAHYLLLLCRTSSSTADRRHGLTQMIVDLSRPGIEVRPIRLLSGEHHFNEVVLEEVEVPEAMVLGDVGAGWEQVTSELAYERSGPERFLSTAPLLLMLVDALRSTQDESALRAVGSLTANLWALRQLSLSVAVALESGRAPNIEAALVKEIGTRLEGDVAETARLVGPVDGSEGSDPYRRRLAEAILTAPGFTIRGGTTEILRGIIARGLGLR